MIECDYIAWLQSESSSESIIIIDNDEFATKVQTFVKICNKFLLFSTFDSIKQYAFEQEVLFNSSEF